MLEAGWNQFSSEFFRLRVELSIKELEYLTARFNSLVVAASILAGFAFTALVELEVGETTGIKLEAAGYEWMELVYYTSVGSTMAFSLYIIVVATLASIRAQRVALHGNVDTKLVQSELPESLGFHPGAIGDATRTPAIVRQLSAEDRDGQQTNDDMQLAIDAMRAVQPSLLVAFGASLLTFVVGACAMVWIKTVYHFLRSGHEINHIAIALTAIFAVLLVVLGGVTLWLQCIFRVSRFHRGTLGGSTSPQASRMPEHLRQPLVGRAHGDQ